MSRRWLVRVALAATGSALALGGCAAGGGSEGPPGALSAGRVQECKSGDTRVASEAQCLQDDAACYPLASGDWCTGERGNRCPTGSVALAAGAPCPPGARCIDLGESLTCTIAPG